ncbi:Iron-sulfur flavoprotein [Pseudodesulfovibrio hydrargyri]|uniref:Iron-sulfur flavoprotein n=1 Tax=Pseudodesulfovibrio hydrargyri TaxID=2125990 RepID=A0A1J5MU27_9BACT|nr:flavodoxin family protein [Pseudodesulfovibrio hydrargyri]OIQ50133.1 Iron-sulfur flavoprotein [Pseudodesulfovibrio hydrargyri]
MSKNILIISASPRKNANSDILCDEFLRGAEEAGHRAEKIRLAERHINYCTGCCTCVGKPGRCVQKDDMNAIYEQILAADVLVLASPVYFRSFNGQMKTFMDRVCPIYPLIHDKDVYFIAAAAGGSFPVESTFTGYRVFTDCLDVTEKGTVAVTGLWNAGGAKGTPASKKAFELGRSV